MKNLLIEAFAFVMWGLLVLGQFTGFYAADIIFNSFLITLLVILVYSSIRDYRAYRKEVHEIQAEDKRR